MEIYFIGIGGIGVSALAQYYLEKGHKVNGSDLVSSETTRLLKKKGAKILIGKHKAKNLPKGVDLVVYSPAIQKNNPELKRAYKLKSNIQYPISNIQIKSYPQALGDLTKKYFTIAVCGTHGKSTTSAMIALILIKAGLDPTVILGTKLKEFEKTNFRMGNQYPIPNIQYPILVIEADEWQASFLNYWPKIIVLTNIEKEHLDYYKNLNHILKTYKEFVGHLSKEGILIVNKDDENISKLQLKTKNFSLKQKEVKKLKKILKVPGEHNVYNALAALTLARVLKIPDKISFKALSEFQGTWRRFEVVETNLRGYQRGLTRKITIISDYAHHPTEIKATIEACREKFKNKKIWLIFQPHQALRTFYLFDDFVKVFKKALQQNQINRLIITDIYDVAGREQKEIKRKISSKKIIKTIDNQKAVYLSKEKIVRYLKKNLKGKEVVIIMGAGDIYYLTRSFKK